MKMERVAEVIRGWPYDGSLDRAEPIKAAVTLVNGDWVVKQSDGTIDKSPAGSTDRAGLVVVGNGDSASVANSNKAVVLWSNFIVRVSNYTAGSWAPGLPVTVKAGKLALATVTAPGASSPANVDDMVIGYVLDVVAASSTTTANVVVVIK